jgi:hypothetical protein
MVPNAINAISDSRTPDQYQTFGCESESILDSMGLAACISSAASTGDAME